MSYLVDSDNALMELLAHQQKNRCACGRYRKGTCHDCEPENMPEPNYRKPGTCVYCGFTICRCTGDDGI